MVTLFFVSKKRHSYSLQNLWSVPHQALYAAWEIGVSFLEFIVLWIKWFRYLRRWSKTILFQFTMRNHGVAKPYILEERKPCPVPAVTWQTSSSWWREARSFEERLRKPKVLGKVDLGRNKMKIKRGKLCFSELRLRKSGKLQSRIWMMPRGWCVWDVNGYVLSTFYKLWSLWKMKAHVRNCLPTQDSRLFLLLLLFLWDNFSPFISGRQPDLLWG